MMDKNITTTEHKNYLIQPVKSQSNFPPVQGQCTSLDKTYYKIKIPGTNDDDVFTSNGFMNQVTITKYDEAKSQLWYFQCIGPYESYTFEDFFQQDSLNADEEGIGSVYPRFGLKLRYTWQLFWKRIAELNKTDRSAVYKVFFLERHGKATNNARPNDALDMRDSQLVQDGFLQALHVQSVWASELAAGLILPQLSYCSPFTRTLATNTITFGNLPNISSSVVTIVEDCRERVSPRSGDEEHRHCKKYIQQMFPGDQMLPSPKILFEDGFKEHDPYFASEKATVPNITETEPEFIKRVEGVLEEIFGDKHEDETFVHITTHAGWIDAFCIILGRAPYSAVNSVVLPIVVKAKKS